MVGNLNSSEVGGIGIACMTNEMTRTRMTLMIFTDAPAESSGLAVRSF